MKLVSTFDELAQELRGRKSSLTIGVFDGVHLGHQALITQTVESARQRGYVAVAVSFCNHPLSILAPPYNPLRLITPARKADLFGHMGIDVTVMIQFTKDFSQVRSDRFISDFLVKEAAVRDLVCGYDFTFGSQGAGNVEMLKAAGLQAGFTVCSVGAVSYENQAVKSTHIRDLLSSGSVEKAALLLTRPHELPGIVGTGMQRGRTIGYPTANLQSADHFQTPGGGVYLCGARIGMDQQLLPAMVNIGRNPTFGENEVSVEAHILNFDGDIRGQALSLFFLERLRSEQKFSGVDALIQQLNSDRDQTEGLWGSGAIREMAAKIPAPVVQSEKL